MEAFFSTVYSEINIHGEKAINRIFPKWVTANGITFFRGFLAFPVIFCFEFSYYSLAIAFYTLSGLLDYVDGALARSRSQISEWGKFLDPMMDKCFVLSVGTFLVLKLIFLETGWWGLKVANSFSFSFLVILEIFLAIKRIQDWQFNKRCVLKVKKELKANIWGKVKFFSEILGVGFLLLVPFSLFFAVVSAIIFLPAGFFATKSLVGKS